MIGPSINAVSCLPLLVEVVSTSAVTHGINIGFDLWNLGVIKFVANYYLYFEICDVYGAIT